MIRDTVHRLTAPVIDRIPDFSGDPPRRQATIGLIASIIVHLLLFLFFVVAVWLTPQRVEFQQLPEEEKPLEIEVVPLPKMEPERMALDEEKAQELLLSKGLTKSDEKPETAQFESDQDMKAGSELPASGLLPLPSQDGRTDRDQLAFTTQDVLLSLNTTTPPALDPLAAEPPQNSAASSTIYQPQPVSREQLDRVKDAAADAKLPTPAATPARVIKPIPKPAVPVPKEDQLAIGAPKPATPAPKPEPKAATPVPAPVAKPAQEMAKLTTPAPQKARDAYLERLDKTRVEGNVSNMGRPGVNAVGTPLGVYVKNISTIVGSRWNFKVKEQMEWLTAGAVRIRFTVDRQGRTGNIEVLANNSNRNFADLCVQVIRDSKLEPIPPEVIEHLDQERLEIPFTFTLYPTH